MRELTIISGKGGTGKTSVVASFAALAERSVLADCDVDAADLHLVLDPKVLQQEDFSGGKRARIDHNLCTVCGKCREICRFDAVSFDGEGNERVEKTFRVDPIACEGCGVCAWFCPEKAIIFEAAVNGRWFVSETRHGPMVHAKLGIAEENSGKLVTTVRQEAKKIARQRNLELIIVDGSPGIGCPVIASITATNLVLTVTEPTVSGLHDLERVADLTRHFNIPNLVCVNKWDLNRDVTAEIEKQAKGKGMIVAGRIRYDKAVTEAQIKGLSIVEYKEGGCAEDIRELWKNVLDHVQELA
ncbi:MAG TPA: ATP-binding protein [Syntrophorhabdaceae bacterium]|nr:ATP-binding protein [Syntrophorhabdaceae bacterium]HQM81714.1 ATP-binding protein [Syntrophorhabdaceae bacterium]